MSFSSSALRCREGKCCGGTAVGGDPLPASVGVLPKCTAQSDEMYIMPCALAEPTTLPQLDGKWRLLYTSSPGTNSPIQRTFTGIDQFSIFQVVDLTGPEPRVDNVVEFGGGAPSGYLKVSNVVPRSRAEVVRNSEATPVS